VINSLFIPSADPLRRFEWYPSAGSTQARKHDGKKILISPHWIERVGWSEAKVFVNLSRDNIRKAPEFAESDLLTRDYESRLHRHYDRPGYWIAEPSNTEFSSS
jgi:hypothetical protein